MTGEVPPGTVVPVGDAAFLLPVGDPDRAREVAAALRAVPPSGVVEVVGGWRSVLVVVDPERAHPARVAAAVASGGAAAGPRPGPGRHRVPVAFDGPDLMEVGAVSGVGEGGVVDLLARTPLTVALLGFSPGFAYLTGLPEVLASLPRRATPRPVVPAGSLGLAGGFAAVYPQATPGGWHLVGRTSWRPFSTEEPPFARLAPGDVVELVPVAGMPVADPPPVAGRQPWQVAGAPTFVVEEPGFFTTVQDAGRRGLAHLGVPRAGPADPLAHELANRLVDNPPGCAALEVTAAGPLLRCTSPAYVAVVGAHPEVWLDGRPVDPGRVFPVAPGQVLAVPAVRGGLRTYVAWAGGVVAPEVLGSPATDVLAGLGPGPLVRGDQLGTAGPRRPMADRLAWFPPRPSPAPGPAEWRLRVVPGPHPDRFPPGALERLAAAEHVVAEASDRVGLRLVPAGTPLEREQGELDSQGMVRGAVQVPPDGVPVLLGPDHATVGGYPVVAVVAGVDLWMAGQCRPGDTVRLVPVGLGEARAAWRRRAGELAGALAGRYPVVAG